MRSLLFYTVEGRLLLLVIAVMFVTWPVFTSVLQPPWDYVVLIGCWGVLIAFWAIVREREFHQKSSSFWYKD